MCRRTRPTKVNMKRRVALIIETSSSYGRDLLAGVVRYMRIHDDWSVFLEQRDLTAKPPLWLKDWCGDGVISRATTPQLLEAVAGNRIPLVELTDRFRNQGEAHVQSDDAAIGRMAAEHLMERGFQRFAYCGFANEEWSKLRQLAFEQRVHESGYVCQAYNTPWHGEGTLAWEDEQHKLGQWLGGLARPVGVMACNDIRGQHVLDACTKVSLVVPEDVAVIGVDNDELLCRICSPPLSSVIPNAEAVGFRAAELLDSMMKLDVQVEHGQLISPVGIATRQSTDVVAIDDPQISIALQYIREQACLGLSVDDVAEHAKVSRSTLERQLRKHLGRTPQQQIRSVQIKRVCDLLAGTDLSLERIAALAGFEHPEYMHVVFRRGMKMTPGEYRRHVKLISGDNISYTRDDHSH